MIKANHHQEQAFFVLAALIAEINASNENVEQAVWIWNGAPNNKITDGAPTINNSEAEESESRHLQTNGYESMVSTTNL